MEVTTKLNLKDKAYFLYENKVKTGLIYNINIDLSNYHSKILYSIDNLLLTEDKVFISKEELLKTL